MQNRLIQSACEAFAAASDVTRSRSDSGSSSSRSSSLKSTKGVSPIVNKRIALQRTNSYKRRSISLQSIPDDNGSEADENGVTSFKMAESSKDLTGIINFLMYCICILARGIQGTILTLLVN